MNFPDDADGNALRRIAEHSDLSNPMTIDFMIDVPSERAGHDVARCASARGYSTRVEYDEESERWTCYCTKSMLATYDAIVAAQTELGILSDEFGGCSDGWGTFGNSG
ncbi:ribonuclease E inhibitor RraB [Pendulispora brunnea]|uniref:Ribonuclease E inhibitor RraB n=1 Tax=Pendulispora brunnea TaxID=2905690 RepID=A0ABZ2KLP2_9BACT